MSLISLYTDILERQNIEYDIIYMDKYGEEEEFSARKKYVYKNIIKQNWPRPYKALKYFRFKEYAVKILNKNKYDFIIVWNDIAILMFGNYLAKRWAGKYCLNIRDYCYQNEFKWVYNRFNRAIKKSAFTTISSDGYKVFLPEHEYIQIHSLNMAVLNRINPKTQLREINQPIRISFIGYVRYYELNKQLLTIFKNDNRFQLCFFGTNAHILEQYARENGIVNVSFHETFPIKDTYKYIQQTDLINNLYGNNKIGLRTALSIKLYHGIYSRIPILVNKDTWGEKIINEYGIGYVVNEISENLPNEIYNWYSSLDFMQFDNGCISYLRKIAYDNERFVSFFKKIIEE